MFPESVSEFIRLSYGMKHISTLQQLHVPRSLMIVTSSASTLPDLTSYFLSRTLSQQAHHIVTMSYQSRY